MMANNILDKILETKKKEVSFLTGSGRKKELIAAAKDVPPARDFQAAVTRKTDRPVNLVAEIKKASPSAGLISENLEPARIAEEYQEGGANAISVLTDRHYFRGRLEYIGEVREASGLPVLRKDFLIDPVQLYESRAAGADAVLLITAALEPAALVDMHAIAGELGMGILLEVHDARELEIVTVSPLEPSVNWVLGINNRNLETFEIDLDTTVKLRPMVPKQLPVVSESGIWDSRDVRRLAGVGVNAVLVGESLVRSGDVKSAIKALLDEGKEGNGK